MSEEELHQLIEQNQAFYIVQPYHVVAQTRQQDGTRESRMVQAGFDIDVYGVVPAGKWQPSEDYWMGYASATKLIERIEAHTTETCCLEVIPFAATVIVDTHRQMQR